MKTVLCLHSFISVSVCSWICLDTVGSGQRGGPGDFDSLSSESDWSISDDEADSTTRAKSKKSASGSGQTTLSDQWVLHQAYDAINYELLIFNLQR